MHQLFDYGVVADHLRGRRESLHASESPSPSQRRSCPRRPPRSPLLRKRPHRPPPGASGAPAAAPGAPTPPPRRNAPRARLSCGSTPPAPSWRRIDRVWVEVRKNQTPEDEVATTPSTPKFEIEGLRRQTRRYNTIKPNVILVNFFLSIETGGAGANATAHVAWVVVFCVLLPCHVVVCCAKNSTSHHFSEEGPCEVTHEAANP